jgi:hypothetical protein
MGRTYTIAQADAHRRATRGSAAGRDRLAVVGRSEAGQPRTYRLVRSSPTPTIGSAYRHLLVVLLGLDTGTLTRQLRAQRVTRATTARAA